MTRALHRQLLAVSLGTLFVPALAIAREKPDWNLQDAPAAKVATNRTAITDTRAPTRAEENVPD